MPPSSGSATMPVPARTSVQRRLSSGVPIASIAPAIASAAVRPESSRSFAIAAPRPPRPAVARSNPIAAPSSRAPRSRRDRAKTDRAEAVGAVGVLLPERAQGQSVGPGRGDLALDVQQLAQARCRQDQAATEIEGIGAPGGRDAPDLGVEVPRRAPR